MLLAVDGSYRKTTNKASWAVCIAGTTYADLVQNYQVTGIDFPNVEYDQSKPQPGTNNRGESIAMLCALDYIQKNEIKHAIIISDSEYCIKTITIWYKNWQETGATNKKNLDVFSLIDTKKQQLEDSGCILEFEKVKSHIKPTVYEKYPNRYYYVLNDLADQQAQALTL